MDGAKWPNTNAHTSPPFVSQKALSPRLLYKRLENLETRERPQLSSPSPSSPRPYKHARVSFSSINHLLSRKLPSLLTGSCCTHPDEMSWAEMGIWGTHPLLCGTLISPLSQKTANVCLSLYKRYGPFFFSKRWDGTQKSEKKKQ